MNRARARLVDTLAPTVTAMALTTLTALALGRVFSDHTYLRPMLTVALGAHAVAVLLRALRVPSWLALPLLAFTLVALVGAVYYPTTMWGPLPTGRCIHALTTDLRSALKGFASAVPPVASVSVFARSAAVALGAVAMLADTFAFRANGRLESVIPAGVMFITAAALDTDHRRLGLLAAWISVAALQVGLLRLTHSNVNVAWLGQPRAVVLRAMPSLAVAVAIVGASALWLAPRLPGANADGFLQRRDGHQSVTQVVSPLIDIRNRLNRDSNTELFTVEVSDGAPHNWRLMGLAQFDGVSWSPQNERLSTDPKIPPGEMASGHAVRQRFTIANLTGHLVPSAAYPTSVSPSEVLFSSSSQSLVVRSTQLQAGDSVMVWSTIARLSPRALRAAGSATPPPGPYLDLPTDLPATVAVTARRVTLGATTSYDQMLALQEWFRGNFDYDRTVQFGGGSGAIVDFLDAKRGFCQQFAATFAAMARTLGVPARVGVGFTPGVLGSDGRYHVYGRHAHAWPEVWFDGIGWVAFEPTPGRGNPDTSNVSGVPFQQDDAPGNTPVDTTPTTTSTLAPTTTRAGTKPSSTTSSVAAPSTAAAGASSTSHTTLWVVLLALMAVTGAITVVRLRHRRVRTLSPAERIDRAWDRSVTLLVRRGAPTIGGATPNDWVAGAATATAIEPELLQRLAALVTRCVYAPAEVTDDDADVAEQLSALVEAAVSQRRR